MDKSHSEVGKEEGLDGGGACKELLDLEWCYHTVRGII
jgi:hypothetical protein